MDDSCEEMMAEGEYWANKRSSWEDKLDLMAEQYAEQKRKEKQRKAELAMYQACSQMGTTKKKRIGIVCSEEQYKTIKRLALENDTNMSDYILKKLFETDTKVKVQSAKTKKFTKWEDDEPPIDFYDDGEF